MEIQNPFFRECWQQAEVEGRMIVGKKSVQKVKQQLEGNTTHTHARKRAQGKRQLEGITKRT